MKKAKAKKSNSRKKAGRKSSRPDAALRHRLVELLNGGEAHVTVTEALADFPQQKRGVVPSGMEHSGWQLLEHIRIALFDILEFSRNPKHVSPDFPEGYWPTTPAPPDDAAWDKSVQAVKNDLQAMIKLLSNPHAGLHTAFPWGNGQTLLREALLAADHNAYHLGQMVDLRRALGIWKK